MLAPSPMPNSARPLLTEADILGALAGGGEEDLGLRRVGVFFQEVVLDLPGVVVAAAIRDLDLGERVLVEVQFAVGFPGARQLQFIEHTELHVSLLSDLFRQR